MRKKLVPREMWRKKLNSLSPQTIQSLASDGRRPPFLHLNKEKSLFREWLNTEQFSSVSVRSLLEPVVIGWFESLLANQQLNPIMPQELVEDKTHSEYGDRYSYKDLAKGNS